MYWLEPLSNTSHVVLTKKFTKLHQWRYVKYHILHMLHFSIIYDVHSLFSENCSTHLLEYILTLDHREYTVFTQLRVILYKVKNKCFCPSWYCAVFFLFALLYDNDGIKLTNELNHISCSTYCMHACIYWFSFWLIYG